MTTEDIVLWLRDHAKRAEWSWRYVMLEAAERLEQAAEALEQIKQQAHGEE